MEERLQKLISRSGLASRRAAEEMILRGEVSVNGKVVSILGAKADPERDHIKVKGRLINPQLVRQTERYYLLNKPRGYLSSSSDTAHRPLVLDLVPAPLRLGLRLVGRLDFNTEGLILLSTDGQFAHLVSQAGKVPKVYDVKVKGSPTQEQIARLRLGIRLETGKTAPAEIRLMERTREGGNAWYEVTLIEGKNQQIRKMFDSIGHSVTKLRRVKIGHLTDKGLPVGQMRELTPAEVKRFQKFKERSAMAPESVKTTSRRSPGGQPSHQAGRPSRRNARPSRTGRHR